MRQKNYTWTEALTDDTINGVMVIERNKGKASFVSGLVVNHYLNGLKFAKWFEVVTKMVLFSVILNATHKDLLHSCVSKWLIGVLKPICN